MVNYSKWDAIGDSSDDEAPSRLAQDVESKLAVAPPQAPPRNPKAEVLTDRANQVVNSLIEKHGEDKSRLLGPDERAAYREACTLYDGALKNIEVKDDKLSSALAIHYLVFQIPSLDNTLKHHCRQDYLKWMSAGASKASRAQRISLRSHDDTPKHY